MAGKYFHKSCYRTYQIYEQEVWLWSVLCRECIENNWLILEAGGLFNHFDGSVDLLDDLDDHYTAKAHKRERQMLVERFQALASEFSVRVTILGGDVHLAAVGRFYSNPKLGIPISRDHRYMANIISSAIVNKPPPAVSTP